MTFEYRGNRRDTSDARRRGQGVASIAALLTVLSDFAGRA